MPTRKEIIQPAGRPKAKARKAPAKTAKKRPRRSEPALGYELPGPTQDFGQEIPAATF